MAQRLFNDFASSGEIVEIYIGGTDPAINKVLVNGNIDNIANTETSREHTISSSWAYGHVNTSTNPHPGSEKYLGLPSVSGYILSSTTTGNRSWVTEPPPVTVDAVPSQTHTTYPISCDWAYYHIDEVSILYEPPLPLPDVNGSVLSSTNIGTYPDIYTNEPKRKRYWYDPAGDMTTNKMYEAVRNAAGLGIQYHDKGFGMEKTMPNGVHTYTGLTQRWSGIYFNSPTIQTYLTTSYRNRRFAHVIALHSFLTATAAIYPNTITGVAYLDDVWNSKAADQELVFNFVNTWRPVI